MNAQNVKFQIQIKVPQDSCLGDCVWELEDAIKELDSYYEWEIVSVDGLY